MNSLVTDAQDQPLGEIKKHYDAKNFYKEATIPLERDMLRNEARLLRHLSETGIAPQVIALKEEGEWTTLVTEYLGRSQEVTDEIAFRRNCASVLITLNQAGVVHGDLTEYALIVRDNFPMICDLAQSRLSSEPGPDKRSEGDAYHLWQAAGKLSPDTARHVRKWQAIRPYVGEGSVLDLGCHEGDYTLFALSENPNRQIVGIEGNDQNFSRAMEYYWGRGMISFKHTRLVEHYTPLRHWDTAFLMSVYSYLVEDYGRDYAAAWLGVVIDNTGQLFFENQLHGDGPGPAFFQNDDDIYKFLKDYGRVEKITTIHVHGRDYDRTVWRVV